MEIKHCDCSEKPILRRIQTAILASATESVRIALLRLMAECSIVPVSVEEDAHAAMDALRRHHADLLIADAELPQVEGANLARLAITSRRLPVRPAAMILCWPEFQSPHRPDLEEMGVVFVEKPVASSAFRHALRQLETEPPHFPDGERLLAEQLLSYMGFPDHIGSQCLKAAALLCAGDIRLRHSLLADLYPKVGAICGVSAAQAERSMRHATDLAWQSNKFENQYRVFKDTVDAGRGQPTCGEMISRLADILRLEG